MTKMKPCIATFIMMFSLVSFASPDEVARSNIVVYLADDLGMANIQAYNGSSKIPTPEMDRMAAEGCLFLDAHSPSAVCTPTRYSLLTGKYPFRSSLDKNVHYAAYEEPLLKSEGETIAGMLRRGGYATAAFGKWHLGIDCGRAEGPGPARPDKNSIRFTTKNVDFSKPIRHHAVDHGFDYFFGLGSSLNHDPYSFIENDRVTALPTEYRAQFLPPQGGGPFREGWVAESWDDEQTCPRILDMAVSHIRAHIQGEDASPLFVYYASPAPHVPWMPPKTVWGRKVFGAGGNDDGEPRHNDMVVMNDVEVGTLRAAFEDPNGDGQTDDSVLDNTLFIVTSDNGACVGYFEPYRGKKGDIYEGGHRVPFIARWPANVSAGGSSEALFGLQDLYATFAEIARTPIHQGTATDSRSALAALRGDGPGRITMAVQKGGGSRIFAWRDGPWKLVLKDKRPPELYHLVRDPEEINDIAASQPERTAKMKADFTAITTEQ